MTIWQIILLVCGLITLLSVILCVYNFFHEWHTNKELKWIFLWIGFLVVPLLVIYVFVELGEYISESKEDGGVIKHYRKNRKEKKERIRREKEEERITKAYENGELQREELPRFLDGEDKFELKGLFVDKTWEDLVYVENEYSEELNNFFRRHPVIQFKHGIRVVYLPQKLKDIRNKDVIKYWNPCIDVNIGAFDIPDIETSDLLLKELCHPEDFAKMKHGLISGYGNTRRYGAETLCAYYFPLEVADDDNLLLQIEDVAKEVFMSNTAGLYSVDKRFKDKQEKEDAADIQFGEEVTKLLEEVRERVEILKQRGVPIKILEKYIEEKPRLSRLVITKDMRIILPDYQNMEIPMEPINKAVYLLFLRHPEGILFKHLPDYRKELAEIYQKIKPLGLNERALKSIEDVTNPCLNSINEKCARIRSAFVSRFDDNLAKNYYIFGWRGFEKKISLDRKLVIWE